MDDKTTQNRIIKFNSNKNGKDFINILDERQDFKLSLRKEKIEQYLLKKRLMCYRSTYEIDFLGIPNIPNEIKLELNIQTNTLVTY